MRAYPQPFEQDRQARHEGNRCRAGQGLFESGEPQLAGLLTRFVVATNQMELTIFGN
jgi:hypothetical protein